MFSWISGQINWTKQQVDQRSSSKVEPAIGIRMCESMDPGTEIRNKIETGTESDYYLRIKTMMELSMETRV